MEVIFLNAVEYWVSLAIPFWMSNTVSKRHPFSFIFNLGNKAQSQGVKSSEYIGWGMITMLLLVTNSVVLRDVWACALSWWRSNAAHVKIFC
jgi:hypothetical protein